jgi:ketosteroid isomerase-like protein
VPDRKRVEEFVAAVVHGNHAEAIENFYHEDASMQENHLPPRNGRNHLVAHEKEALADIQSVNTMEPSKVIVDGDNVVIHWHFIVTGKDGIRREIKELALQVWRGDRIKREQFFYDTATAWQPVT